MIDDAQDSCFVCGGGQHPDATADGGHRFFSIAEAQREANELDRRTSVTYADGQTTPEAAYIAEHRPN